MKMENVFSNFRLYITCKFFNRIITTICITFIQDIFDIIIIVSTTNLVESDVNVNK